jgi:hypothetical protein
MGPETQTLLFRILLVVVAGLAFQQALIIRRHYGVCGKLLREAERTVDQEECRNPLTRIDSEFIKCGSADTLIDDGRLLCAVNRWAEAWEPGALASKLTEVSVPILVAALVLAGIVLHVAVNAWVADRHNQRQVQLMRESVPALMQRQAYFPSPPIYADMQIAQSCEQHRRYPTIAYVDE